ncbi:hypothetical protein L249_8781 [Ophiocordyceps polyrhachis-furcata BCC 54312]|uniref:Uncharacterized protein n=1 Tax=Ophiocordyceps polyrhachis-furcata BCC 54312 TaxID=1330021 RepID=A0A367L259_9HYPO|nr:hypothetical protein L249_8781 [Ophiocordyceps polyrhachis-furcata BCC 54312]
MLRTTPSLARRSPILSPWLFELTGKTNRRSDAVSDVKSSLNRPDTSTLPRNPWPSLTALRLRVARPQGRFVSVAGAASGSAFLFLVVGVIVVALVAAVFVIAVIVTPSPPRASSAATRPSRAAILPVKPPPPSLSSPLPSKTTATAALTASPLTTANAAFNAASARRLSSLS